MSFTGDTEIPSKNPFSPEYKEWLGNLASDVARLNKYLPLFDFADLPTGSGGGGAANVFLAIIVSSGVLNQGYVFEEISDPSDPFSIVDEGRTGIAWNTMETGLVTDDQNLYVPPGFTAACFNGVFVDSAIRFEVLPIAMGTIVHVVETAPLPNKTDPDLIAPTYSISVQVPVCVSCAGA